MWTNVLIANRGEIARRIARSARALGFKVIVVYHEDDQAAPFVKEADIAYSLGTGSLAETYLNIPKLLEAAQITKAQLIHPGYGFLSERADFARACQTIGVTFIGPPAEIIELMGNKASAKQAAIQAHFPCAPGYDGLDQSRECLLSEGEKLGVPLMVKAIHGGGGRGMRLVTDLEDLSEALEGASREALSAFGDGSLLLERALLEARHIEVQVFGDQFGQVVHLGERDCSVQRRRQKVIEESPSPNLSDQQRTVICQAARSFAQSIGYIGAGTIECLWTPDGSYYFCEMNTRLQVEHPVTELRFGVDLVEWQFRVAMGEALPLSQTMLDQRLSSGRYPQHVLEARLYAEDPAAGYLPQAGSIKCWRPPCAEGVRVDDGVGEFVSARFDAMLAKLITVGDHRNHAIRRLDHALDELILMGPVSNLAHLKQLLASESFREATLHTKSLDEARPASELAPQIAPDPDPLEYALAALALSLPHLKNQSMGKESNALEMDGWGNAQSRHWEVRLSDQRAIERGITSSATCTVQVEQQGATEAIIRVLNEEFTLTKLHFDPVLARMSYALNGQMTTWIRAWISPENSEVSFINSQGYERCWRDLSYERFSSVDHEENTQQILAPISGLISSISCKEGEQVSPDQTLITIEAMKLEHALFSSRHATIAELHTHVGAQVSAGQLLLQFSVT